MISNLFLHLKCIEQMYANCVKPSLKYESIQTSLAKDYPQGLSSKRKF